MSAFQYLDYNICLTDPVLVKALQAEMPYVHLNRNDPAGTFQQNNAITAALGANAGHGIVYGAPTYAAIQWNAPIVYQGSQFRAPCITSQWLTKDGQTTLPASKDDFVKATGGWFGITWLFGSEKKYVWRGRFVYVPSTLTGGTIDAPTDRRWIDGFENPTKGDGSVSGVTNYARSASRHADGMGMLIRGATVVGEITHSTTENGGSLPTSSRERVYIKLLEAPTVTEEFWRCTGTADTRMGATLKVDTAKRIVLYDRKTSGSVQMALTTPLTLNKWYCLDLLFGYGASAFFDLYLDHVATLQVTGFNSSGLGNATTHASSSLGGADGGNTSLAMNFDDWISCDLPANRTGNDFVNGSKVVRITPTGPALDEGTYTKDWRSLLQLPADRYVSTRTSSTSGDRISVTTDAAISVDSAPSLGITAFTISVLSFRGGLIGDAKNNLGYKVGPDAEVLTALATESVTTAGWKHILVTLPAILEPLSPLSFIFEHAANTNLSTVCALVGDAELIGVFGQEDVSPTSQPTGIPGNSGLHNAPYPRTPWANLGAPPESPVAIFSGTYAGNSIGQDLEFITPVHWLFIRDVAANTWNLWWSSMHAANFDGYRNTDPATVAQACIDPDFTQETGGDTDQAQQTAVRIAGADTRYNLTGHTYQYVAVSDPGMRFMLNGALKFGYTAVQKTETLVNSSFLPAASFFQLDDGAQTANNGVFFKGPGHTSDTASPLDGASVSTVVTVAAGSMLTKSGLTHITAVKQIAFNLWRMAESCGGNDPGLFVQTWTYTGNGAGARTLDFVYETLCRPLFAIITPHGGASEFRDPSHNAASTTIPTTGAARITGGGIDTITVASSLNSNGVVYEVFLIVGGTVALHDGWSDNGTFIPYAPSDPCDGPWDDLPTGDVTTITIDGTDDGNPLGTAGNEFGTQCIKASTKVCNTSLLRLGITKGIGFMVNPAADPANPTEGAIINADGTENFTIVDEPSAEADACRLVYEENIMATLREFNWPFATSYKTLTLLGGTEEEAFNSDWQYVYQLPADYVKARRIINPLIGRAFDPNPPKFKIGADTTGLLTTDQITVDGVFKNNAGTILYTNEPDAELEYTYRPGCAAGAGDALFRSAVAWRITSELAPSIARNKMTAAEAWGMYLGVLRTAGTEAGQEQQDTTGEGEAEWTRGRE